MIAFRVTGNPVPKQSFVYARGGGYSKPAAKAWQVVVRNAAILAVGRRQPIAGPVAVRMCFTLPDRRRRDCDNLSKAVNDALTGVVWQDDSQVMELHITKCFDGPTGVSVEVEEL